MKAMMLSTVTSLLVLATVPQDVRALTVRPLDLEELVDRSSLVFVGRVLHVESYWQHPFQSHLGSKSESPRHSAPHTVAAANVSATETAATPIALPVGNAGRGMILTAVTMAGKRPSQQAFVQGFRQHVLRFGDPRLRALVSALEGIQRDYRALTRWDTRSRFSGSPITLWHGYNSGRTLLTISGDTVQAYENLYASDVPHVAPMHGASRLALAVPVDRVKSSYNVARLFIDRSVPG